MHPSTFVGQPQRSGEGATVSVANLLLPPKIKRLYAYAETALAENKLGDAERELDDALKSYPGSAVAWCLMGILHEEKLDLDKAFMDYSQALLADSHLLPAYLGLARVVFREQRRHEVIGYTDQVVRANPTGFPVAYLYDAAAHFNLEDFTAAEKSARKFESLDTEHERPRVYLLLGDILAREHDYAGAAEQKKKFLTIVPKAHDAEEIKEEIKVLEDFSRGKASNANTSVPYQ